MYCKIGLPFKVEVNAMECRMRLDCFTEVLETFISDAYATRPTRRMRNRILYSNINSSKLRWMLWSVGRDLTASLRHFRPRSVMFLQLERR
jgi:hypothetical protein